jgi:PadR family transcriptional regulator PadR
MTPPRMTTQTLKVLALFLEDARVEWYGFGLVERAKIKSGTLYPILIRLEKAGWLESRLEEIDSSEAGRPARRMYSLTGEGEAAARAEVAAQLEALRPASGMPKAKERFA